MRMKKIMLLLICIMISISTYADIKDVIRAISEGSNLNIQLVGKEVNRSNPGEIISDLVKFNFTPNGFDYNDKRVFGVNMTNSDLDYSGHNIILRKSVGKVDNLNNDIYTFFIVDTDIQPRFSFALLVGSERAIPMLVFNDGKGNERVFKIIFCTVIGADGSILLPQNTMVCGSGQEILKTILESIAKTVDLE